MKWHASPSARCSEHGLTLGRDGRCVLCRRSEQRAAPPSRWAAAAAVAGVVAGTWLVASRLVVYSDDAERSPAVALPSASQRTKETDRSPSEDVAHPGRRRAIADREPGDGASASGSNRGTAPTELAGGEPSSGAAITSSASRGIGADTAEDRTLGRAVSAPAAGRRPGPTPLAPPEPPPDPDSTPVVDDPRDFAPPARAESRPPWTPSL